MRNFAKLANIVAFSGIALTSSLAPANAFQFPTAPANREVVDRRAASAYAEDVQGAEPANSSRLSAGEIKHVSWCAARYRFAYDATNDTYFEGGVRSKCLSPR